ncbi:MAG: type I glyceraldehyde-3-phosphate dehydrogenase [Deltaproteobacteria bacterium]|nr:type I glyceraldehyde-3-phosphate dehydrogenase [Deltaproteobacteria bacterium]MBW2305298.1 type I glyceraldehyde-3-phosphate dehydrogenase [Deltaproteobacteria bacterium]
MSIKIAINGFGRIGRYMVRCCNNRQDIDLKAINTRADTKILAHILKYDSVHGKFSGKVETDKDALIVNGNRILVTRITGDISKLPWKDLDIDVVMESTGKFLDKRTNLLHLKAGARKVIIGAPAKRVDATLVYGVNHTTYDPDNHHIISNGSCTTNCLAPVAKVLHESFGIERGLMTTIHSYTMDQRLLDGSHKDLRRARAGALSMIPTTTGAAVAVAKVIPELKGKLDGLAIRVPTPNVSFVDFTASLKKKVTVNQINKAMKEAASGPLKGILDYCEEELVSIDFTSCPASAIVDAQSTNVVDGNFAKVLAWYDNEAGFSSRMIDLAVYIVRRG